MRVSDNGGSAEGRARWEAGWQDDFEAVVALLGREGIGLRGRRVTVIDDGVGALALAMLERGGAASVLALAPETWDEDDLVRRAGWYAGLAALPDALELGRLGTGPGERGLSDVVLWWAGNVGGRDAVAVLGALFHVVAPQGHIVVRTPTDGAISADEIQRAVLVAGLRVAVAEIDAVSVRPSLESQADAISALAVRGARIIAYRPE